MTAAEGLGQLADLALTHLCKNGCPVMLNYGSGTKLQERKGGLEKGFFLGGKGS